MSDHDPIVNSTREMFERLLQELEQPTLPDYLPFDDYNRMCAFAVTGTRSDRVTDHDLQAIQGLRGEIIQAYAGSYAGRIGTPEGKTGGVQGEDYELDTLRTVVRELLNDLPAS